MKVAITNFAGERHPSAQRQVSCRLSGINRPKFDSELDLPALVYTSSPAEALPLGVGG
jgi:hypothetical protein